MQINRNDPDYWKKRAEAGAAFFKKQAAAVKKGRPLALDSPEQLWDLAMGYFERCDSNPWIRTDFKGKLVEEVDIPTAAPYLWSGLDAYCFEKGVCMTLKDYRTVSRKKPEEVTEKYLHCLPFAEVIRAIDDIMVTQKVSGGLVNAYNSNLVARLEGLVDKTEDVSKGANKRPKFVFVNKIESK